MEHVVQLALLIYAQGPSEQLVRSLGVVDEHVEHIPVRPIGDGLAALPLDRLMGGPDAIECALRHQLVGEDDPLRVARGSEEPADRVGRQLPGEEQPVDGAVERELRGRAGEDEEDHVSVSPDPAHDRTRIHEL